MKSSQIRWKILGWPHTHQHPPYIFYRQALKLL
jgi:hypothetical protein